MRAFSVFGTPFVELIKVLGNFNKNKKESKNYSNSKNNIKQKMND